MVATALLPESEAPIPLRPLTVDEVMQMAKIGIIGDDERIELLDGVLVPMSPINPPHAYALNKLTWRYGHALPEGYLLRIQDPVRLSPHALPQPDLAIVRERVGGYAQGHPEPGDILLLIEVADSSLQQDRTIKLRLYADAGIREYWLFDLVHRQILVFREPENGVYREQLTFGADDSVAPLAFPEIGIRIADIV